MARVDHSNAQWSLCGAVVMTKYKQQGIALIAVLWVTAFLTTIASTVAYQSRSSLQITKNRIDILQTKQAAESIILLTVAELVNNPSSRGIFYNENIVDTGFDNIDVKVAINDESGKIDLNTAPAAILQGLLLEVGLDETESINLANAILDWRDEDSFTRVGGAEDADYLKLGLHYESKDADFQRIEELKLVRGMNSALFNKMRPYITVHTQDFGINLTVASELVRRAFNKSAELENNQARDENEDFLGDTAELISATSGYIYTIQANAVNDAGIRHTLSAIVRLDRGNIYEPFTILQWNQR